MFHKSLIASLVIAAGVGVWALVKSLDKETEKPDDQANFIKLQDDKEETKTEEETKEDTKEEEKPEQGIAEVCALYPYLSEEFVQKVLDQNPGLNEKYPEDTLITLYHKADFPDAETMNEYIEILKQNGYEANVLGETEAEVYKKMFTENGRIISDIYNVANQAVCLKGTYKGYKVVL